MLSLDQFIDKWTGKKVDVDGVYPNMCMDLMHTYLIDCFGLDKNVLATPSAYQLYTNFDKLVGHEDFDRIVNTPSFIPREGDIGVFGQAVGINGHVCIYQKGNIREFWSFDANWPIGTLPHIQYHTYYGCLGWLRYKKAFEPHIELEKAEFIKLVTKSANFDYIANEFNLTDEQKLSPDGGKNVMDQIKNMYSRNNGLYQKLYEQCVKDLEGKPGQSLTAVTPDQTNKIKETLTAIINMLTFKQT